MKEKSQTKFLNIISLRIPFLQQLILLCVYYLSKDNTYCVLSNKEFSEILYRDSSKISQAITALTKQNTLIRTNLNGKRVLALGEIANPLIIKNNKKNKNYLFIHKDNTININNCDDIANDLIYTDDLILFDHTIICKWLLGNSKPFRNVKTAVQLKAVIRSILNKAKKDNEFPQAIQVEFELAEIELKNTIRKICGYKSELIEVEADEEELKRIDRQEKQQRILLKGIKESLMEEAVDISTNPTELQKLYKGQKIVTIKGNVHHVYEGGTPPICNIILKTADPDTFVYASILLKHYKNLKAEIDRYQGTIKVTGQVKRSDFHIKKFGVENIIRSIDELEPIEFLDNSPF